MAEDKQMLRSETETKELEQLELSARRACDQYGKTDQGSLQPIPREVAEFLRRFS